MKSPYLSITIPLRSKIVRTVELTVVISVMSNVSFFSVRFQTPDSRSVPIKNVELAEYTKHGTAVSCQLK